VKVPWNQVLNGGIGPGLAPIRNVDQADLRRVIGRMKRTVEAGPNGRVVPRILGRTYVAGLAHTDDLARGLFGEVLGMEESRLFRR